MKKVRLGIIGVGVMGSTHSRWLLEGKVPRIELAALCDTDPEALKPFPQIPSFSSSDALIRSGKVDAVLVATPHYDHTTIGIAALKAGLHVMVEKPISVHKADAERLIKAHTNKKQVFSAMFNQRTDPSYIKLRGMIRNGELGTVRRVSWIITNWFRTQAYYNSGGWRATWAGEGGGVLLNQCPHQIDLWQWLFGMPDKVRAFCTIGRYHKIEVEDDVTAYFQYKNGTTGTFITSTGEAPGTNRLEVAAERGRVVIENGEFRFTRNEAEMSDYCQNSEGKFGGPAVWNVEIPIQGGYGPQHLGILQNFAEAILDKKPLIAPAPEGIHGVELANAMLMSSFLDKTIDLPLKGAAYEKLLKQKIATSKFKKVVKAVKNEDLSKSFSK